MDVRQCCLVAALACATVLVAAPAHAQKPGSGGLQDDEIYGWNAPPPDVQLERDEIEVPPGMGALFVPTLSNPSDEPEFVVLRGERRVAAGLTGERLIVEPGAYTLELGSGHDREVQIEVVVDADQTTVVPVVWGGLRIEVVDENNIPLRAGYELIRVADRDLYGVGYGADLLSGERVQTWVLPPDLYRVVPPGASYRARTDYATVYVPPGGFVRYRLVIDPETGEFQGAGVVTPEEAGSGGDDRLTTDLVLGINGNLRIDEDVIGTAELFLDGGVTWRDDPHNFVALLQLEEGLQWIDPEVGDALPLQKSDDRVRLDLLYSYELTRVFGPYVRSGVEMEVLPNTVITTEDVSVTFRRADGTERVEAVDAGEDFRTADFFGRVQLFEGAGINAWALRGSNGELRVSVGLGLRQNLFDLFAEDDGSTAPNLSYTEVENSYLAGPEALLFGRFRLGGVARFTTNFEAFSQFNDVGNPSMLWENTLSLKLLSLLSLDYSVDVTREPDLSDEFDLAQEIVLRFSWEIL